MPELTEEEKAQKKAEKAARAAEFAKNNPNLGKVQKPKLTKAERRAKQEAQVRLDKERSDDLLTAALALKTSRACTFVQDAPPNQATQ